MKRRLLLIFLTLVLAIGTCVITGCGSSDEDGAQQEETTAQATEEQQDENAQSPEEIKTGMLSMLNITEEQFEPFLEARGIAFDQLVKDGYASSPLELSDNLNVESNVVFFDSLDAMLMSLNAGEIQTIDIYQSVAAYLCATNDNLVQLTEYDTTKDRDAFAKLVFDGCLANDFAFLLRESDEPLRDQFNDAIANMKADGTMDRLVREQILDPVDKGTLKSVKMPKFPNSGPIKVAVTGDLPPMDYVGTDGQPAGFNTAVLAEISTRIGRTIEISVVDSIGRASGLSSGTVDAVFWARASTEASRIAGLSKEQLAKEKEDFQKEMTDEQMGAMERIASLVSLDQYAKMDMPEHTIMTDAYLSDIAVAVTTKDNMAKMGGR